MSATARSPAIPRRLADGCLDHRDTGRVLATLAIPVALTVFDWRPPTRRPAFRSSRATWCPPRTRWQRRPACGCCWKRGNAVDAAIAAAAAMTVCEPVSNGLGSDAFAILWDGKELHGLNASGRAPAAWTPDYFKRKYGADAKTPPKRGIDSVTVPGAVAGWVAMSERFGKLPFADLLEPAIEIAERGYLLPIVVQQKWAAATPELGNLPGFAQAFLPWGRAPKVGELFQFQAAARGLRAIAQSKGEAFYGGEIAQAIERFAAANGGGITARRPRRLQARMGQAHRQGLPRSHAARDSAQRPGHRRADRARHPAAVRSGEHAGGRRRFAAPADRSDEAGLCRHLPVRGRPCQHGGDPRADAGRRLPGQPRQADRHEARAGFRARATRSRAAPSTSPRPTRAA